MGLQLDRDSAIAVRAWSLAFDGFAFGCSAVCVGDSRSQHFGSLCFAAAKGLAFHGVSEVVWGSSNLRHHKPDTSFQPSKLDKP